MFDTVLLSSMYNNCSCASTDIYHTDTENQYRRISEDAGTIFISITSRATEEKEALFNFYYFDEDHSEYFFHHFYDYWHDGECESCRMYVFCV